MRVTRVRRAVGAVLITTLVAAAAACSSDQPRGWSVADAEEGFAAILAHADSDRAVSAGVTVDGVFATIVPEPGSVAHLLWPFDREEVLTLDRTSPADGFPDDERTLETTFPLAALDVRAIVERDPCDLEFFTFEQRAAGIASADPGHVLLQSWCSDTVGSSDPGTYHGYLDEEPLSDVDPTDPVELARLTETARDYTDDPDRLVGVTLGHTDRDDLLEFLYTVDPATTGDPPGPRNLVGAPCRVTYQRTVGQTGQERPADMWGAWPGTRPVQTSCLGEEYFDPIMAQERPFEAGDFDPNVMLKIWNAELADAPPTDGPFIRLVDDPNVGLLYWVHSDTTAVYDLDGNEVDL